MTDSNDNDGKIEFEKQSAITPTTAIKAIDVLIRIATLLGTIAKILGDLKDDENEDDSVDPVIINAADHGYDGTLEDDDIQELFREYPNAEFVLPSGEYPVRSVLDLKYGEWEQFSVRGAPHARLVVDDPSVDQAFAVGSYNRSFPRLEIRNLTLVVDGENNLDAGWGRWHISERVEAENLTLEGRRDYHGADESGDKFSYYCNITEPDGFGHHRNIRLPDGDVPYDSVGQKSHVIGVGSEPGHVGTQVWEGCYVSQTWDNGFYLRDGVGSNILIGCVGENCGGANFRLGTSDVAIGCQSFWNIDPESELYRKCRHGVLFDSDEANATAVMGLRAIRESGRNDCVRLRTDAETASYRDIHITNKTSQHSLRVSGADDSDHGVIQIDGLNIEEASGTSVRGAAVSIRRPHVAISGATYTNPDGSGDRAFIEVLRNGGARVRDSNIEPYAFTVRQTSDGHRLELVDSRITKPIRLIDSMIELMRIDRCDLTDLEGDLWETGNPDTDTEQYLISSNFE